MKIANSKAFYDYTIQDHFEAGISLLGTEVKAIRQGHADLTASFVRVIGGEAYLINAKIFPYQFSRPEGYDIKRTRKLLLHKQQLISIKSKTDGSGLTIVPISLYTKHHRIKVELALGKPKKKFEKRESIKQKDIERDIQEALKNK